MNDKTLRLILIVLSVLGIGVASYLMYGKLTNTEVLCLTGGGCGTVEASPYSEVRGIPVALFGLVGYIAILAVLILENISARTANASTFFEENGPLMVFGMSMVGFIYSMYLTYLELGPIGAICSWCVTSAIIMTLVFGISVYRVVRTFRA
jgi:uncharacterized membrane protein